MASASPYPLKVDLRAKEEILACDRYVQREVRELLLNLIDNPYAPEIIDKSVEEAEGSFYQRLFSGYTIFWEIAYEPGFPMLFAKTGLTIRIIGLKR